MCRWQVVLDSDVHRAVYEIRDGERLKRPAWAGANSPTMLPCREAW
jgi:nitrite reductase/ring-hydroxylating ferredoxin subunit